VNITFVLPTVNMSGGIRVVTIYAQHLARRGHRVVLVSPPPQDRRLPLRQRLQRWLQPKPAKRPVPKSHLDGLGLDHRLLDRWRPVVDADVPEADVVIATWWETAEWVAALSESRGAKVYLIQHHEVFPWLAHERSRATYHLPLHKVVVARWLQRVMADDYGDTAVDIVHNSVDHDQFFAEPRGKQTRPTVGFLYSSVPFKGVDVTLRAVEVLREALPDLRVLSFGNERLPERLASQIEFQFDPAQHRLRDIYAACDVWLTASRSEGFNLPAMEAMACRTPVVSTRTGWPEEALVEGLNGACVDIDDSDALAEQAARLLRLSDEAWRRASLAAFDTVASSSWERSADQFEAILTRAASNGMIDGRAEGTGPGDRTGVFPVA
jgi:glycosyltransferase involved in cell wall biosynthesis